MEIPSNSVNKGMKTFCVYKFYTGIKVYWVGSNSSLEVFHGDFQSEQIKWGMCSIFLTEVAGILPLLKLNQCR